jgi:hypothetical protein
MRIRCWTCLDFNKVSAHIDKRTETGHQADHQAYSWGSLGSSTGSGVHIWVQVVLRKAPVVRVGYEGDWAITGEFGSNLGSKWVQTVVTLPRCPWTFERVHRR